MPPALRFVPALAMMGLIYGLSAQPNLSSGIEGWDFLLRKLGHMAVFGALFLALLWALPRHPRKAAAIAVLYAVSDEVHQSLVAGRHGTPIDVLIDTTGIALAWLLATRRGWLRASRARWR